MELHRRKVARFVADMEAKGIRRQVYAPPLYRRLWELGLAVPPPLFLGFVPLAVLTGVLTVLLTSVGLALFERLVGLSSYHMRLFGAAVPSFVFTGAVTGTLYGLGMAAYYRWKARQFGLGTWGSYPAS